MLLSPHTGYDGPNAHPDRKGYPGRRHGCYPARATGETVFTYPITVQRAYGAPRLAYIDSVPSRRSLYPTSYKTDDARGVHVRGSELKGLP